MRIIRRRSTAWIAGLAYLLAGALSGSLHHHNTDGHSANGHSHAPHRHIDDVSSASCDDLATAKHLDEIDVQTGESTAPEPLSDDDCLACRFAAQCAVVLVPTPELRLRPIVAEVRVAASRFFIEPVYSNALARAPPLG